MAKVSSSSTPKKCVCNEILNNTTTDNTTLGSTSTSTEYGDQHVINIGGHDYVIEVKPVSHNPYHEQVILLNGREYLYFITCESYTQYRQSEYYDETRAAIIKETNSIIYKDAITPILSGSDVYDHENKYQEELVASMHTHSNKEILDRYSYNDLLDKPNLSLYATKEELAVIDEFINNYVETSNVYTPSQELQDANTVSEKHGGLDLLSALELALQKLTINELFDKILFPTEQPVMTPPTLEFVTEKFQEDIDVKVGSIIQKPTADDVQLNLGGWTLDINNGVTASAGPIDKSDIHICEVPTRMPTEEVTIEVLQVLKGGSTPKDNKGNDADVEIFEGGNVIATQKLYPYMDWYATTVTPGEFTKQPVVRSMGCKEVEVMLTLCLGTDSQRQGILVPGEVTKIEIEVFGTFHQSSLDEWDRVPQWTNQYQISYNSICYTRRGSNGPATFKVTVRPLS